MVNGVSKGSGGSQGTGRYAVPARDGAELTRTGVQDRGRYYAATAARNGPVGIIPVGGVDGVLSTCRAQAE